MRYPMSGRPRPVSTRPLRFGATFAGWAGAVTVLGSLSLSAAAQDGGEGQPSEGPIFIRAERLIQRPGVVLENAQILVEDGLVVAVGRDLEPPEGARILAGKVVCAGFLDPWSALGIAPDLLEDGNTSATTRTVDGLQPIDPRLAHLRLEALRSGVTSVRLQGGKHAPVGGLGAVVALDPEREPWEAVLLADASLAMSVALSDGRPPQTSVRRLEDGSFQVETGGPPAVDVFERIDHADRVGNNVGAGKKYRDDLREFQTKLAEWEKQIAEKQAELDKDFKKAQRDREKAIEEAKEKGKEHEDKRYREDRKPRRPRVDDDREVLGRIADGELPLVVEAHRAAEIRALLDGTKDYGRLRWILAGGTEALVHAEELARRRIPVLVWPALRGRGGLDEHEGNDLALAGQLAAKGVTVLLGSGGRDASTTRDLPLLAALAVAHGLPEAQAFEALTLGAARAFDVADLLGSVEFGKRADLLLLDGEPLATTTRVRYVLTGGRVAVAPEEN